ncbi:MAG: hypothetical protein ACYC4T_13095 [Melioribacteraceae bacterium]
MDNIFQLLIFLFVIYTIFNTIAGKKKPQNTGRKIPQENPGEDETETSPNSQYSPTDVLQDLFGMKIPKTGSEYETYSSNKYPSNFETGGEDTLNQIEPEGVILPDIDYDKLPSLESQQKNISVPEEEIHKAYEVGFSFNSKTSDIKQKIKSPQTLQELYLISEILNKPKARRR